MQRRVSPAQRHAAYNVRSAELESARVQAPAIATSCFEDVPAPALDLPGLMRVLRDRYESRPDSSYSASLFNAGRARIVRKVGEEATEVIIAALSEPRDRVVSEVADLMFHVSVLLTDIGIDWSEIGQELSTISILHKFRIW